MTHHIIFEPKKILLHFAADRIPGMTPEEFMPCSVIGFADLRDGLMAVAIFNNYRLHKGVGIDAQMTFVACTPRWATRGNIRAVFTYAFHQLRLPRLTCITAKGNKRARKLCEGMGFTREGTHPRGVDGVQTAISYGLLPENCHWLKGEPREQIESLASARA